MELAVKDKIENKAFGRTEFTCELTYDKAMPSRKELREALSAATGAAPELMAIISVDGSFGSNKASVIAHSYKDKAAFSVERRHLLVRDGLAEAKKKVAKAKAPPKK